MPADQTILFTLTPRAVTLDPGPLPISVFVAPRLRGASTLDAFPDWLEWTQRLAGHGLELALRCGARTATVAVDRSPLEPRLWAALFGPETHVRSHTFDDYSGRAVLSYSVRDTLGALKSIYQRAAVELALPDRPGLRLREGTNRALLRELLQGLEVHWNQVEGERWREELRQQAGELEPGFAWSSLDAEGLPIAAPSFARNKSAALPFAVYHHMPTPDRADSPLGEDWATYLDFHQALASLNAYPALQRALGIVFDLDLPEELLPPTGPGRYEQLVVEAVLPGLEWALPTATPALATACVSLELGAGRRAFLAAPRLLDDPPAPLGVIGLLDLDPMRFGLAQVDVDGAMHKAIILAETWSPDQDAPRSSDIDPFPERAAHREVFDPEATLPSLRSGGLSLFADRRAQQLLDTISRSKRFDEALSGSSPSQPLFAEDLVRGYRLDVWDSWSGHWHSLHLRTEDYSISGESYHAGVQEGFVQLATTQPAPGAEPASDDLYLHEAIARWAGWSLSLPFPGKHLSRYPDAEHAVPSEEDPERYAANEPVTPFKLAPSFGIVNGSLPRLRFGTRYRIRARAVDLAGNSLELEERLTEDLSSFLALPRELEGFPYLRYEPVPAPLVVAREEQALTGRGSAIDRIVLRTFNSTPDDDGAAAETAAADRHLLPPRTSVELGERLGMFDEPGGKLRSDAEIWQLIADRDAGELHHVSITVAGKQAERPLEPAERIDTLPYLPDPLSRGVALRDLPGTPDRSVGRAQAGAAALQFVPLDDPSPRPGSATIVEFPGAEHWQEVKGLRLALREPATGESSKVPSWDAAQRLLTVYLPKGETATVPLTSFVRSVDLPLLGQWQWLREYIAALAADEPERERLLRGAEVDWTAHVLQRAVEGGHWMLSPPRLLTLVHALQQPLGRPQFTALGVNYDPARAVGDDHPLQTAPSLGRSDPSELAPITAYRRPGATEAYLLGALKVHGAGTAKVDLAATWADPIDEGTECHRVHHSAHVDELPLPQPVESYLTVPSAGTERAVGYYDPEHDQIAFVRAGEWIGRAEWSERDFDNAAPRHLLGDTKRHRVTYTATATSRFSEYFPPDTPGGFTRSSDAATVDVPASARPPAPEVVYVLPTFGWQRQTGTNIMRSVRFGGGLRVYLKRPWFASGEGELLGVSLWSDENGTLDEHARDAFKPYITQWGMDPIWQTAALGGAPAVSSFPDAVVGEHAVPLDRAPGLVDVVGFEPDYNKSRELWFADLTVNTPGETYMPFIRLALVRYQPHALLEAKLSRVVLADFAQLTPDRTATVTFDPYHPREVRVAISGVAPRGPGPQRTEIAVRVQQLDASLGSDLGWSDAPSAAATVASRGGGQAPGDPDLVLWKGTVNFHEDPRPGDYRLLITEYEHLATYRARRAQAGPGRLVYAETFALDFPSSAVPH